MSEAQNRFKLAKGPSGDSAAALPASVGGPF